MLYKSGEIPRFRDRIIDEYARVGTLLDILEEDGKTELIVKWDQGVLELRYANAKNFCLFSRAPTRKVAKGHFVANSEPISISERPFAR